MAQLQALQGEYAQYAAAAGVTGVEAQAKIAEAITSTQEALKKQKSDMATLAHDVMDPLIEGTGTLSKRWETVGENIRKALEHSITSDLVALMTGQGDAGILSGKGMGQSSAGQGGGGLLAKLGGLLHIGKGGGAVKGAIASGGGAPTVQIINQSSQPVKGTAASGDGSGLTDALTPHVISIVLSDLERGGSIAQAFGAGSGLMG